MLLGLEGLKALSKNRGPSEMDFIHYLFWEKGIDLERFNKLPIPYIFSILSTHKYIKKEEEKDMKKQQRKK